MFNGTKVSVQPQDIHDTGCFAPEIVELVVKITTAVFVRNVPVRSWRQENYQGNDIV